MDKNKVAALLSIFPNIFQGLLPYGAQMLLLVASANKVAANNQISFLDVWKYSWYLYLLLITTVILIIFPKLEKVVNYRIYHNLFKNKQQILD